MASSSGTKPSPLVRRISKAHGMMFDLPSNMGDSAADIDLVPSSLPSIALVLRVANEIQDDNPRVAHLCRAYAFKEANRMDPTSSGRGVRQLKTYLSNKVEEEKDEIKRQLARTDEREIQLYYQIFFEKNIKEGQDTKQPEEMAKLFQIAMVLRDVLKNVLPSSQVDHKTNKYIEELESRKEQYEHYNILPLYAVGIKQAIMKLPEINVAFQAIRNVENLPMPLAHLISDVKLYVNDMFDWLLSLYGFQKGNIANQREHLILLLANIDVRGRNLETYYQLDSSNIQNLSDGIFKNYESWCYYMHHSSNHKRYPPGYAVQQLQLIYIALYLLIWGEASNIRFMPECICYIFHHMASDVYKILSGKVHPLSETNQATAPDQEYFLRTVIKPIYKVLLEEAKKNNGGKASHSKWSNYDDLNEFFWSENSYMLRWSREGAKYYFQHLDEIPVPNEIVNPHTIERRKHKTNFVEGRTFLHLYRSFHRMWLFFIVAFQAMVIIAWRRSGSVYTVFDEDFLRRLLTIFITSAVLNLFEAVLDVVLTFNAWRSFQFSQILRYLMKLIMGAIWVVILPIGYSISEKNPTGVIKFLKHWTGNMQNHLLYNYVVVLYLVPDLLATILFALPLLRKKLELSNWRIVTLAMWWNQPKLYVGRGMHENFFSLLKYSMFWIMLLVIKLTFSYFVEIFPLVRPTKEILGMNVENYMLYKIVPNVAHNVGAIMAIWAPIILVYFMDAQIWYAIFSTLFGGVLGAFRHVGEIRTLGMLRSRFRHVPPVFREYFLPPAHHDSKTKLSDKSIERKNMSIFSQMWNEFICSMREEDLISNMDQELLLVPCSSSDDSVIQWPLFLLASKIPAALNLAKDFKGKEDTKLIKLINNDFYMHSAVVECYETIKCVMDSLLEDEDDKKIVLKIYDKVSNSIREGKFLKEFKISCMPLLSVKLEKWLKILMTDYGDDEIYKAPQITKALQSIMDTVTHDVMVNGQKALQGDPVYQNSKDGQSFENINIQDIRHKSWKDKVSRLHFLLTFKESAADVPRNSDARRRITFFANSLFMNMPTAPKVGDMFSFSVLTPYYSELVCYTDGELNRENEDGISTLFYLQTIYPDEWTNFRERMHYKESKEDICNWATYRGQTLFRSVRGMMYYRKALELQCALEFPNHNASSEEDFVRVQALPDLKFTYVVSCQIYGAMKHSDDSHDQSCQRGILNLMLMHPSLRVAYIDEREETVNGKSEKSYYSVLVKGGDKFDGYEREIYRIKLPGPPTKIGEGKPENQNHALIFTRGEALQTIDMNQDNYFEEAFKMRNVLEEFKRCRWQRKPTILGLREHIFTGSVSSLAWFMSNQETSFVTIGQRFLASPLRVRFHYGHPDIFDRIFHITRGGISKASKTINLSEDIFAGFNSTLRGGYVTHHDYIQVGKGRDVGMNQISSFEAKVANGNGEQTLSRDVYRLGCRFDFFRMLSFYFTTVGFYLNSMVTVLTVYLFLYGRLYLVMSGMEKEILENSIVNQSNSLEAALVPQSLFQMGLLLVLPMLMEISLEKGFRTALADFIIMQLQLASVFFTFQLGTKAHYFGRTILHGGSKYRATGRGFVVFHAKFAENYRLYSRSHFVKGFELAILLIVYEVYGVSYCSSSLYLFVTCSIWFLVGSWLFAPFVFNPSGFDWQKTVDDWTDWKRWMGFRGGIGIQPEKSWESWWEREHEHLKYTDIRGRVLEIILALRFFVYQYGIVYHLDIAHHNRSWRVYGISWGFIGAVFLLSKILSVCRQKLGIELQLVYRMLKVFIFLACLGITMVLSKAYTLTISDLLAAVLAFLPTGWGLLLIGQACRPLSKGIMWWNAMKEMSRAYDYIMALLLFMPIAILSWLPFVSEFQTRILFNQAFSRGLQISIILTGREDKASPK
ncbi:LOW QUALITY PROTEIN: callose synthase 7-like [Hibiscus syriacus]|uniref:LOW QUALITY PROTEIN: callose synthase 7-like n=1 Tax=Hibiscus syriacus TaxID=106335 RepID=UPI001922E10D|nr:LOW QUALITY PROTEIN: callose synthase 7-like [Hibiscus syriacus]